MDKRTKILHLYTYTISIICLHLINYSQIARRTTPKNLLFFSNRQQIRTLLCTSFRIFYIIKITKIYSFFQIRTSQLSILSRRSQSLANGIDFMWKHLYTVQNLLYTVQFSMQLPLNRWHFPLFLLFLWRESPSICCNWLISKVRHKKW